MKLASRILQNLPEGKLEDLKLDPDFFTDKNLLDPKIVKVLQAVTKDVLKQLKDKKVDFEPEGVILTGSLTSVNYDASSDVDFHILVDFKQFSDPELMKNFLAFFAKSYNGKFNLRGKNLELYFQDADEPHVSPGIYDVTNGTWLMPPTGEKIEKTPEMKASAANHKKRVTEFQSKWKKVDKEDKKSVKNFLTTLNNYFAGIRAMRKDGIASDGLASVGNQVFKMLRRNNTLDMLSKLIIEVQDQIFEA